MASRSRWPELDGDLIVAETALSALNEAWEASIDELGSTVPPVQLRGLLAIAAVDPVSLTVLARLLRASTSAVSRLCDRLQQAGLITRRPGQPDRRGVWLSPTPAGNRLTAWVREQRRARLTTILQQMTPSARRALIDGLRELPAATGPSSGGPPR
jgi:DNA-binding MarR family transcriptional regulator